MYSDKENKEGMSDIPSTVADSGETEKQNMSFEVRVLSKETNFNFTSFVLSGRIFYSFQKLNSWYAIYNLNHYNSIYWYNIELHGS